MLGNDPTQVIPEFDNASIESVDIYHKPVFKLLKGFKLQQYAMVNFNRFH